MGNRIRQSNTIQAFWVALGSLFSFGFSIISAAILSRYLTKSEYGTYKQVMFIYHTLLTVFTLGLPRAYSYFLPKFTFSQGKDVVRKISRIFYGLGILFSLFIYVFSSVISKLLGNPDLVTPLRLFSLTPFFLLPTMGLDGIFASYKKTYVTAIYTVITRIFMVFCVVLPVVLYKQSVNVAIVGFSVSSCFTFLLSLFLRSRLFKNNSDENADLTYSEIFKFSIPLMVAGLWGVLISSADQFFVSRFFGTEVFAEFANGTIQLPLVNMIVSASAVVLLPLFSSKTHSVSSVKVDLLPVWNNSLIKSALVIYPVAMFCWFYADVLITLLYGDQYVNSVIYFRIKSVVNFVAIVQYAPMILALGAARFYARVHMYAAIAVCSLEYISILIYPSAYLIAVISLICLLGRIYFMISFIKKKLEVSWKDIIPGKMLCKVFISTALTCFILRNITDMFAMDHKLLLLIISFGLFGVLTLICGKILRIDYMFAFRILMSSRKK